MKKSTSILLLVILIIIIIIFVYFLYLGINSGIIKNSQNTQTTNISKNNNTSLITNVSGIINDTQGILNNIKLPAGFKIKYFATNLVSGARFMLVKDNTVYVSMIESQKIIALIDDNKDGVADRQVVFIENLKRPHSIDYYNGWFYIGEEDKVTRVKDLNQDFIADSNTIEKIVDLPSGANHFTRTVKVHDNSLFISIGSTCNVCYETDEKRASILKCNLDGKNCKTYAKGIRNSVGIAFDNSGKMYASENGRDGLGEDIPPDEINIIEDGKNYGWPICYGNNIHDTQFDNSKTDPCIDKTPSLINLQAHSAPLGLNFYYGDKFPSKYKGSIFVAYHGSWNRQVPTGYKVVNINVNTKKVEDFATGWLSNGGVLGRPVGIDVYQDSLLVSDDKTNNIYLIYYTG